MAHQPGQRQPQPILALDHQAELEAADAEIEENLGGNPETKRHHQKWLELWEGSNDLWWS